MGHDADDDEDNDNDDDDGDDDNDNDDRDDDDDLLLHIFTHSFNVGHFSAGECRRIFKLQLNLNIKMPKGRLSQ